MIDYSEDFWRFVSEHSNDDVSKLRLKYHGMHSQIDYSSAITQIECRRKFGKKLVHTLSRYDKFIFPDTLSGEQCTSDLLSKFHATLVKAGETVCDFTSGLGIDCLHVASIAKDVIAVERKVQLVEALCHNAAGIGIGNLHPVNGDSCELLRLGKLSGEVAFIDPARRSQSGGRVYALVDCEPNVVELLPTLSAHFKRMIVKMSPMLDVMQTLRELPGTTDIYAIGTRTECKELVAVVDLHGASQGPQIHAVTLLSDECFDFQYSLSEETEAAMPTMADVCEGFYVYEPLPSIMKAAPLRLFAGRYGLSKLHNNTHVYFSEDLIENVPADVWRVSEIIPWQSKCIKQVKSKYPKIDVATRNFGMSTDALRLKLGVKQGGDYRLLGVTDYKENKLMLILRKP